MLSKLRALLRRLTTHRSTHLTPEGFQFLLFTLAVGVAAINTGNNLFYLLLAMMLSIILMSGIVSEYCLRRLEFHRHLPELLFANEPIMATLVVRNGKSRLPSFSLRLLDVVGDQDIDRGLVVRQLLPGASLLLSYPLMGTKRGRLQLDGVRVVTSFPFGLFMKKAFYAVPGSTAVCPEIRPLEEEVRRDVFAAGQEHQTHRRGHGNDLHNLRLYQSGDDSRKIHWVTTAKTAKLIVRETEAEERRRATIHFSLVAPDSHDALFEEAVAFAASLLFHLSGQGYHLRLVVGSYGSPYGQGELHLLHLLRALALCERKSPDARSDSGRDRADALFDDQDGALIAIQPWECTDLPAGIVPTILFDAHWFARMHHVV
jgi:uncharacterized protein (DUF58 family)